MKILISMFVLAAIMLAQTDRPLSGLQSRYTMAELNGMKTDDRIAFLATKLKQQPNNEQLESFLAAAFLQKLRETIDPAYLKHAASVVDKMLSANPKSYQALRLQNEIDMQRHDFPKVAARARGLLERNPSDSGTVGLLGDALMEMGRYEEAGEAYKRMLELSPNLFSYNRVAYHRFVTGNMGEALSWMQQAVRAGSDSPENQAWCLVEFGDLLFKSGHFDDARATYEQALTTFPGYHRAYAGLGRLFAAQGNFKAAIEHFRSAQASVPFPDYAAMLEALYRSTGQTREADHELALIDTVDKLMRINGETMNRNLAVILADEDRRLDRALELARAELAVRGDVFTYDALSWVEYRRKNYKEATAASEKALAKDTPDPMLYYHAGLIDLALNDKEKAKQNLDRALSLNPKFDFRFAPEAQRIAKSIDSRQSDAEAARP
ncbi:MAG: tetratricopeptide repeat protein [Acidobacteriaceae bacterium]|nr:tetratricopeptide repeat protein [Acidobacteriaceae bacterium]MBV9779482.1 tetratricopeptide repeat protein [Acidobacteriaceae bacterium]